MAGTAAAAGADPDAGSVGSGSAPRRDLGSIARAPKRYRMKKSINLWAFPYPQRMTLEEALRLAKDAGFDAVELNYDLAGDISPAAGEKELRAIRELCGRIGIAVSGLCSFLFWPYSLTAEDPAKRKRGMELAQAMIPAAAWLGTRNLLVVAGAVAIPWIAGSEVIPYDVVDRRAREAIARLVPLARKHGVSLNIENIFFNGYLMSPDDMIAFVDGFESPHVAIHFDTGNIMPFQFPEHWIPLLGKRIRNVHLKEYSKRGTDFSIESFRPLLDGTTDWPAVIEALDAIGYDGYLAFEYFRPYAHYPEALIRHTSDAMDRMLGRA
ncbi:MAG: sugar phosphate isomerase/epimerase [Planctomycetes bacterium]|nr:sugar phosphate isomerase/epimerase [Planctomycetota bacterium]